MQCAQLVLLSLYLFIFVMFSIEVSDFFCLFFWKKIVVSAYNDVEPLEIQILNRKHLDYNSVFRFLILLNIDSWHSFCV